MKNSFIVRFAIELWYSALMGAWPVGAPFLAFIRPLVEPLIAQLLGSFVDFGILQLDLSADSIKIGLERKEYRADIERVYAKAMARVYTEEEKRAIRSEYLRILAKFGRVAGAVPKP